MQPGPGRALPMGILGFLAGMGLLVVIRYLQSLQPYMEPQLGIVLGTALAAAGFIYGMGAFDPLMNTHAHEPAEGEEEHAHEAADEETEDDPDRVLGGWLWLSSSLLILLLVVIAAFALLPDGPGLRISGDPLADFASIGVVQLHVGEATFEMTQLTLLVAFTLFMFVSLAIAAGALGLLMHALHNGVKTVSDTGHTPLQRELLSGDATGGTPALLRQGILVAAVVAAFAAMDRLVGTPVTNEFVTLSFFVGAAAVFTWSLLLLGLVIRVVARQLHWAWVIRALVILTVAGLTLNVIDFVVIWLIVSQFNPTTAVIFNLVLLLALAATGMRAALWFTIVSGILLPLFYFVLIGLVVPFAPPLLFGISAGNALMITALVLRPKFLKDWLGRGAGWAAIQLRRLPNALQ
ncbi:MAG: hypothetical protein OXP68_06070 [Anaerolineaceae bacterium]|nr:hypothetical protein [Anaerolineaceae bacterium]MDE0327495.1 hypothetical protein [Anaerolineaceae bacterium]